MAMEEGRGRREAWDQTAGGSRRRSGGGGGEQVWQDNRRAKEGGGGGGGWDDSARKGCQSALFLYSIAVIFSDPNCDLFVIKVHSLLRASGKKNRHLTNCLLKRSNWQIR